MTSAPAAINAAATVAAIVRGRVHERRLALPLLDDVDVRAALDEQADSVDAARARREHERRFALGQRQVDTRAGVEQCSQQLGVGAKRSFVHRPDAVPVREIRVGFRTEQRLHATHVPKWAAYSIGVEPSAALALASAPAASKSRTSAASALRAASSSFVSSSVAPEAPNAMTSDAAKAPILDNVVTSSPTRASKP